MGCRCNERREQLTQAATLIKSGDRTQAAELLRAASKTFGEDASRIMAGAKDRLFTAAKLRLGRR